MATATLQRQAQLEYATITVQYANPKKEGQRNASIKDVDGAYYWVRPEELQNFQPGVTYEISFVTTESNGYTNRTIKSYEAQRQEPLSQSAARPAPRTQAAQGPRPAVVRQAPASVEQPEPKRQAAPQSNGNGYYRPTSPEDKKSMFRCASITALIRAGQLRADRNEIAAAIIEVDAGYDMAIEAQSQG